MTDDLKEQIRKVQSEYEAAISALDGAVRTMKSFIPENVFAKASIEECERSIESMSRPSPKLSSRTEDESGNGISSAFKQWFEQEWASYRDKSFTDQIAAKAWALKAWRFISANAGPTRTQGAEQCINCGMATDPKCACSRGRALDDDAQPVAIYQVKVGESWVDSNAAEYSVVTNEKRIVYATRDAAPTDAQDAERYQFARDNIMEGYELPNGFYLSDARSASWDATIDAAIAASAPRDK